MRDKRRRWQFGLILTVGLLTVFNILPTVFYYRQPLRDPIDAGRAVSVIHQIHDRVDQVKVEQKAWLESFLTLLGVDGEVVEHARDPRLFRVVASNKEGADAVRQYLPRAGALMPFVPAQLALSNINSGDVREVWVSRSLETPQGAADQWMRFAPFADQGRVTPLAREVLLDRVAAVTEVLVGPTTETELLMGSTAQAESAPLAAALQIAHQLVLIDQLPVAPRERFLGHLFRGSRGNPSGSLKTLFQKAHSSLESEMAQAEDVETRQGLKRQAGLLLRAQELVAQYGSQLDRAPKAMGLAQVEQLLHQGGSPYAQAVQEIDLGGRNACFQKLLLDWGKGILTLVSYADLKDAEGQRWLMAECAHLARVTEEQPAQGAAGVSITLKQLSGGTGLIAVDLRTVVQQELTQLQASISALWHPEHPDLQAAHFPIWSLSEYQKASPAERQLGLVLFSPLGVEASDLPGKGQGLRSQSIYALAKGVQRLKDKYAEAPQAPEAVQLRKDLDRLQGILRSHGLFKAVEGSYAALPGLMKADVIYENDHAAQTLMAATREDFHIRGTGRFAALELSDVEQRILTLNRIETQEHEDILKWRDEYRSAQVAVNPLQRYEVPAPTHNAFLSNLMLSARKYVRGDDRKILRWGLDLSGGKTVRLELRDVQGQTVTNPDALKQGLNELQQRVNRMGVSETTLRQEGNSLVIDFPGLQSLSAAELVKGSSMYFHIVNERFANPQAPAYDAVQQFLQEVWSEAVVTNRKDPISLNHIARSLLGQSEEEQFMLSGRSPAAAALVEAGLHIAHPEQGMHATFSDDLSMIAVLRGDGMNQWMGQTHPLVITFRNYALEGANLDQVHAAYDPTRGNYLAFQVKSRANDRDGQRIDPQELFYAWTSEFAQDRLAGTPREAVTAGRGWRMAVILNGSVISSPALESALRDSAMITGSFSQREVNRLVADLKAGSLSFTPVILSEANISPELGAEERMAGIMSTVLALVAVIAAMLIYYRFAGIIASVALVVNLLILWAVLQNIQATLTLPGLAGIVLTLGMAVDANVLVFERMREELAASGRLAQAVTAGYKKSFSAIIDSSITTIIAGLILLNFDSGPLKGFALTLIIGIVSSMFTALFLTRFVFEGWLQRGVHKTLHMMQAFERPQINFLKWGRACMLASLALIIGGVALLVPQRHQIFGIDFTGGYTLQIEVRGTQELSPRVMTLEALSKAGLHPGSYQVRELNRPQDLMIQLSQGLDEPGQPFAGMPLYREGSFKYAFELNPRLMWTARALAKGGVQIAPESYQHLDRSWSALSGQYSDTMRWAAGMSLLLALGAMLLYLALRFEWRFALAAVVCLANDVLATLAVVSLLAFGGVSVHIDMSLIAALMTILGYSLNDTIIIFDRIREDMKAHRRVAFVEICNHALNATLSRTVMTSGTTLLVVLILLLLGGPAIFGFALTLFIGILIGTVSSWVIATPVLVWLQQKGPQSIIARQEV